MPCFSAQVISVALTYSGPLSTLIVQGLAAPFDDLVQATDDPFGGQREVNLDAQAFAVEVVQHIQQPELPRRRRGDPP
jgi:hypothetical protein